MHQRLSILSFTVIFLSLNLTHCSKKDDSHDSLTHEKANVNPYDNATNFFTSVNQVVVEVFYQSGAEPFDGNTPKGKPYWDMLKDNISGLYQYAGRSPSIQVPTSVSQMTELSQGNQEGWTLEEIYNLSEQVRQSRSTSSVASLVYLFLNGNYRNNDGTLQMSTLGLHISDTTVIAIFKDVLRSSVGSSSVGIQKFSEQAVLVHELGHAFGLVNLGVPAAGSHHDSSHPGHCTNTSCVMYWQNQGGEDLRQFIEQYLASGNPYLFSTDCLNDIKTFTGN